jgi:hypothetical protein
MTWEPTNELRFVVREYSPPTSVGGFPKMGIAHRVLQQKWRLLDAGGEWQEQWRDVPEAAEPTP